MAPDGHLKIRSRSYVCSSVHYDISGNHRGKWLRVTFNANIFDPDVEFHILWAEVFLL